ncbi:MAG: CRISPR-associated protein Cas2 [Arenicella sp.]|jgi:CRISPR-associated protein Cas2
MSAIYIIAYDVQGNKRRRKLAQWLEDQGQRIQYSVFECAISNSQLSAFSQQLESMINPDQDRIVIYPICAKCLSNNSTLVESAAAGVLLNINGYGIL